VRLGPLADLAPAISGAGLRLRAPAWAAADPRWSTWVLAWFDASGTPVAGVLVLRRHVPGSRRYLAYLPAAPESTGAAGGVDAGADAWLPPVAALLRRDGAFAVRAAASASAPATPAGTAGYRSVAADVSQEPTAPER
jgi:hypothetical protein